MYISNNNKNNFLFYDYETFGIHVALDKPAQFACVRTDINFNIINDGQCFYCCPPLDYLPNPLSVLIHGITPQFTIKYGMNEFIFAKKIFNILNMNNTCVVGYNNISFDDELTRNIFYRNLLDPYSWSWKNNNSRLDIMYIIVACYVLSPQGINWCYTESKRPSFKLVDLTAENNIIHNNSHDALSDVYAAINLLRLIKSKKLKLFNFFFKYRLKSNIKSLIDMKNYNPLIYINIKLGYCRQYVTCVIPLFWDLNNINMLFVFDLYFDPSILIDFIMHTSMNHITLKTLFKMGLNVIKINQCPILIPINFFTYKKLIFWGINIKIYFQRRSTLIKYISLFKKIIFYISGHCVSIIDNVDLKLYHGFFNYKDKKSMLLIHKSSLNTLQYQDFKFIDIRLKELFFRCLSRNFPHLLNKMEHLNWDIYCKNTLNKLYIYNYILKIRDLMGVYFYDINKKKILYDLIKYTIIFFYKM